MPEARDDVIYLLGQDKLAEVARRDYEREDEIQKLVDQHPQVLRVVNPETGRLAQWVFGARERGIPDAKDAPDRWSVDHFFLDDAGIPTFVEVKRAANTQIRREVVGQMLDYAANGQRHWPVSSLRSFFENQLGVQESAEAIRKAAADGAPNEEAGETNMVKKYWETVDANLKGGKVRLLFVADELPDELRSIIEFLNSQMPKAEVLGIELPLYANEDMQALVPRVVGQTEAAKEVKRSRQRITQEEFLQGCTPEVQQFWRDVWSQAQQNGLEPYWGSLSFSLGVRTPSNRRIRLLYGWTGNAGGGGAPILDAYTGDLEDSEEKARLRDRFAEQEGVIPVGEFTARIQVSAETVHQARRLVAEVWKVAEELRQTGRPSLGGRG